MYYVLSIKKHFETLINKDVIIIIV